MGAIMELTIYLFISLYHNTLSFADLNETVYRLRNEMFLVHFLLF